MMEVILLAHGLASRSYHPRRRIRFNLDIQELSELRNAMKDYSSLTPLRVVIFSDKMHVLEVWNIYFETQEEAYDDPDVIKQLRKACKSIGVLLRALFSLIRLFPSQEVNSENIGFTIVDASNEQVIYASDDHQISLDTSELHGKYGFVPIKTPCGVIVASVNYKLDCSGLLQKEKDQPRLSMENCIIQDYVSASTDIQPPTLFQRHAESRPMAIPKQRSESIVTSPRGLSESFGNHIEEAETIAAKPVAHSFDGEPKYLEIPKEVVSPRRVPKPYGYGLVEPNTAMEEVSMTKLPSSMPNKTRDSKYPIPRPPRKMSSDLSSSQKITVYRSSHYDYATSPLQTPPFSFKNAVQQPSSITLDMPSFGTSPPYRANPSKLIASSPHTKSNDFSGKQSQELTKSVFGDDRHSHSIWGIAQSDSDSNLSKSDAQHSSAENSINEYDAPFAMSPDAKNSTANLSDHQSLSAFLQKLKHPPSLQLFSDTQVWSKHLSSSDAALHFKAYGAEIAHLKSTFC